MKTPEQIATDICDGLSFSSNRMVEGRLVGEQYFAAQAIAAAIQDERVRYERAIQHCETSFRRNKTRMWVLKILREQLR